MIHSSVALIVRKVTCIEAIVNTIVEFNNSLVYCVVQYNFHVHDPPWFIVLMLELLIKAFLFMDTIIKAILEINQFKVNAYVRPHFLTLGYYWYLLHV